MVSKAAVRRPVPPEALPDFAPVPRRCPRHDGWTAERQRAFIEALADTGCVAIAARMVNMSPESAYLLRRAPDAGSFRRAWDAAQTLGLQPVKDEAFHRAMHGQLVPVFVGGKLMGFRRKKNDRLLMFILRHYGEDGAGRKTTVNYFSTRAGASSQSSLSRSDGEGDRVPRGGGAMAEASATTVRTVITGPAAARDQVAADDVAAAILNAFQGVALDAEAQAEIYRTLEACAERRRALEHDPENDPDREFVRTGPVEYLGELESGVEGDWVEFRPEGEHRWEALGEGGEAAEIDRVVADMAARKALLSPEQQAAENAAIDEQVRRELAAQRRLPKPEPELSPDDPRLDWRNWTDEGYVGPSPEPADSGPQPSAAHPEPAEGPPPPPGTRLRKPYRKRTPKPPFTPPDDARKAEAVAEVKAARRAGAAAEAERRKARAARRG